MSMQRRQKIGELLMSKGVVSLRELEAMFPDVSSMTLRRDLQYMESIGIAIRIRGGARYVERATGGHEDVYPLRASKNASAKESIARLAVGFMETGRSIFLDSGSTIMSLARIIPDISLSVLTSGPNIAMEVLKKYNPSVTLIGGMVNRDNLSVSGAQSLEFIKHLNFDLAFIVPSALSLDSGLSCGNYNECELKRVIISRAKRTIVLVDSSKIDRSMPFTFAELSDIDMLITDRRPPDELDNKARSFGVKVMFGE